MRFAAHTVEAQGNLTLTISSRDETPIVIGSSDWQTLTTNTVTMDPGHVKVEAEVVVMDKK
jgi:hypothetical protein